MPDLDPIFYNIATFICALFVLEFGADKFIDHTAIVAKRTGISQTVIALLTAGAEWEELAVVVVSIARHRPCLAYGNIIGSTISNILGAFSLGLLFHNRRDEGEVFDGSSKVYSTLLLVVTTLAAGLVAFGKSLIGKVTGAIAITVFAVYLISIGLAISKGKVTAPELSDSDDDGDSSDEDEPPNTRHAAVDGSVNGNVSARQYDTFVNNQTSGPRGHEDASDPEQRLLDDDNDGRLSITSSSTSVPSTTKRHSIPYHVALLVLGFLAITLSAYVLSTSAANLATALGLSDVLVGVIILSLATTLPEKLIAVLSGARGQTGIMIANTVGSNIFLLTLCLGVLWVSTDPAEVRGCARPNELAWMLGATVWMTVLIWINRGKWARGSGAAMLLAYVGFLVAEYLEG